MEQWTSTDLHHAINSTPSDDELSDLLEDIERIVNRKRTEIQMCWQETKADYMRQYDRQTTLLVGSGGRIGACQRLHKKLVDALRRERINLMRELGDARKEEAVLRCRAIEYVVQKGGYDCRTGLFDLVQFPSGSIVPCGDIENRELQGLAFVPDLVFDSVDDGFEGRE